MLPAIIAVLFGVLFYILFRINWSNSYLLFKPKKSRSVSPPKGADMGNYGGHDGR
jgi:hypothetical protein